ALLAQADHDPGTRAELGTQTRRMMLPIALAAGLIAFWSAMAPLSGAVVATGQVKVELNRKTVQHQEGGIVREILVRDGQHVRAGQALPGKRARPNIWRASSLFSPRGDARSTSRWPRWESRSGRRMRRRRRSK